MRKDGLLCAHWCLINFLLAISHKYTAKSCFLMSLLCLLGDGMISAAVFIKKMIYRLDTWRVTFGHHYGPLFMVLVAQDSPCLLCGWVWSMTYSPGSGEAQPLNIKTLNINCLLICERALGGNGHGVRRSWQGALIMPPASRPTEPLTRNSFNSSR